MPTNTVSSAQKKKKKLATTPLPVVDWNLFWRNVEELASEEDLPLTVGPDLRILAQLALLFWCHKEILERAMYEHWEERRRNARSLLKATQKVIDAAKNLVTEEAWIQTRFAVCGTGRHTVEDIGVDSKDYIYSLQSLSDPFAGTGALLMELLKKRKPVVDDDQNLFLCLMASKLKYQDRLPLREGVSKAAINRRIQILVEAWRLSLGIPYEVIDVRDIGRRINGFRQRNKEVGASIDSNPPEYILLFLDPSQDKSGAGLRREKPDHPI